MRVARLTFVFARHLWRVARGGQLRFRLETFGLYYPALPYQSPLWRVRLRFVGYMLRRLAAYVRWLDEMERIRAGRTRRYLSEDWAEVSHEE